jgi:hypothetical protein
MTINQLFIEQPPNELVHRFCQVFGLSGISDRTWFSKTDMASHNTIGRINSILLDDLKKLYIKCKARSYLRDINDQLAITILRQLLKTQGGSLKTRTVSFGGDRVTQYQLNTTYP